MPDLVLLSNQRRNLEIAKRAVEANSPEPQQDGSFKFKNKASKQKWAQAQESLRMAQAQVDDTEDVVLGRWHKGSKATPFKKKFSAIIDASLAISPAVYRQWKGLDYTPIDPNIEDLEKSLREQKELLKGLRVRREKMYEDVISGPQRFFKGFKSNYLLETPFKKPTKAEELSQAFIQKAKSDMATPTGQPSRNYPVLETGREYRLASGMWVGVTKDEQPFYKTGATKPPKIITAADKDYDHFTKVLTKLNREIAALGR